MIKGQVLIAMVHACARRDWRSQQRSAQRSVQYPVERMHVSENIRACNCPKLVDDASSSEYTPETILRSSYLLEWVRVRLTTCLRSS